MNHIERLTIERDSLKVGHDAFLEGIIDLKDYLLSSKFYEDTTVQVKDVLMRLQEIITKSMDVRVAFDNAAYREYMGKQQARLERGRANCEVCDNYTYDWTEAQYQDMSWHIVCKRCRATADIQSKLLGN